MGQLQERLPALSVGVALKTLQAPKARSVLETAWAAAGGSETTRRIGASRRRGTPSSCFTGEFRSTKNLQ